MNSTCRIVIGAVLPRVGERVALAEWLETPPFRIGVIISVGLTLPHKERYMIVAETGD